MVSLMTALWFSELRAEDRVSVKPHASPVLHAINYLLGRSTRSTSRRCAPSAACRATRAAPRTRTRSTTRPARSASARPRRSGAPSPAATSSTHRFEAPPMGGAQIALVGDAELDEGAVWEAVADPMRRRARRGRLGRRPQPAVARPGRPRHRLRPRARCSRRRAGRRSPSSTAGAWRSSSPAPAATRCASASTRCPTRSTSACCAPTPAELRERLPGRRPRAREPRSPISSTTSLRAAVRDLGGHDLASCSRPTARSTTTGRPSSSPTRSRAGPADRGPPREPLRAAHRGADGGARRRARRRRRRPLGALRPRQPRGRAVRRRRRALARAGAGAAPPPSVPPTSAAHRGRSRPSRRSAASSSTSCAPRPRWPSASSPSAPTSPARPTSAAGSTRSASGRPGTGATGSPTTPRRSCTGARPTGGQHIELGIAETNLVGLLGELGATWSRYGQPLLPIGTIYDPFVERALGAVVVRDLRRRPVDPGRHAVGGSRWPPRAAPTSRSSRRRSGSSSPAAPPGSRRSGRTSSGRCCTRSSRLGRPDGESAYFRLSTRPLDQAPRPATAARAARGWCSRAATCAEARGRPAVTLVGMGAVVPEVLAAADAIGDTARRRLRHQRRPALPRARAGAGLDDGRRRRPRRALPAGGPRRPLVTVLDGDPHALAFLGGGSTPPR